jgi:hypothetical protein
VCSSTDVGRQNWESTVGRFVVLERAIFIAGLSAGLLVFVVSFVAYRRMGRRADDYEAIN